MNAESKVRELVQANLSDNDNVDGVRFIDQLLLVAAEVGEIYCTLAGASALRFQTHNQSPWQVGLERPKTKLRLLCARLAVLCNERGGQEVSPYGGEGDIERKLPERGVSIWKVRFKNTPSEQEFTIVAE